MYTLDQVIKKLKSIESKYPKNSIQADYYNVIVKYLLLEQKYKEEVKQANKPIYHYFMHYLPQQDNKYFEHLYNPYNPVRFAVETFDSIEVIRQELKRS